MEILNSVDQDKMSELDKVVFEMLEKNIPQIEEPFAKRDLIYIVRYFISESKQTPRYEIQYFNKSNSKLECITKFLDSELKSNIIKSMRSKKLQRIGWNKKNLNNI